MKDPGYCGLRQVCPDGCRQRGFTLAELLVASVVMSIALLGVYAIFQHAMAVEATATIRWNDRESAEGVVSHLARVLAEAVNVPDLATIQAGPCPNGGRMLICQTTSQRRRYEWHTEDQSRQYVLLLQKKPFAGMRDISMYAPGVEREDTDTQEKWDATEAVVIARHIDGVAVLFRPATDPSAEWREDWDGRAGDVAVHLRVTAGQETAERIVVPGASEEIGSASEQQG